jgi:hypothetical protein
VTTLDSYRGLDVLPESPEPAPGGRAISDDLRLLVDWNPKSDWEATGDPSENDDVGDDFYVGSTWRNSSTGHVFVCTDNSTGAAKWKLLPAVVDDETDQTIVSASGGSIIVSPGQAIRMETVGTPEGTGWGSQAVDFQSSRTNASEVASGTRSFIAGGQNNTASNENTFASGDGTAATGLNSAAFGRETVAFGGQSLAHGDQTVAGNTYSEAGGIGSSANQRAQWARSTVLWDNDADEKGRFQATMASLVARTTGTGTKTMSITGHDSPNNAQKYRILNDQTVALMINIVARKEGGTSSECAAFLYYLLVHCETGDCDIVGTPHKIQDFNPAGWGGVSFNTGWAGGGQFGYLEVDVTGAASTNIRWQASITASEVRDPA